jgi:hypothetical protein
MAAQAKGEDAEAAWKAAAEEISENSGQRKRCCIDIGIVEKQRRESGGSEGGVAAAVAESNQYQAKQSASIVSLAQIASAAAAA